MKIRDLYENYSDTVSIVINDAINFYRATGIEKTTINNIVVFLKKHGVSHATFDAVKDMLSDMDIETKNEFVMLNDPTTDSEMPDNDNDDYDPVNDLATSTAKNSL